MKKSNFKIIAKNRQAFFDYEILEKIECGVVLQGKEIKAIRAGKVNLTGSYGRIFEYPSTGRPELFWLGGNINLTGESDRIKKLLVKKSELKSLIGKSQVKGLALVPLELYLKSGKAKLLVGIARGRRKYDKRELIKRKDIEREQKRMYNS